jgi:branched-chain amino acid aminotransferase
MNGQHVEHKNDINGFAQKEPSSSRGPFLADYVWLDGELVPSEDATVHFHIPILHNGPGVFDGIRCYNTSRGPAVFRLAEHLQRFLNRIRALSVDDFRYDVDELRDIVCRVIQVNRLTNCYVRPALYFEGSLGLDLTAYRPVLGVAAWKSNQVLSRETMEIGIRLMVSSFTRTQPGASMSRAKINGRFVNAVLARMMALKTGFDEAIMLDSEGYVAEDTGKNLLLVRDNTIYTTPRATILEGITRDTVVSLARDAGYAITEERISRDQLFVSDELLVCGTAAEILPVHEIDFRPVGSGGTGPVTRKLQNLFAETIEGHNRRSAEWLDYMVLEPVI